MTYPNVKHANVHSREYLTQHEKEDADNTSVTFIVKTINLLDRIPLKRRM